MTQYFGPKHWLDTCMYALLRPTQYRQRVSNKVIQNPMVDKRVSQSAAKVLSYIF